MSKYRQRTRGVAQDHNIAVVLAVYKKTRQAMLNNKFKYWEGQILCIRLNYGTGYCTHESVPLCHDLLRLSLCSCRFVIDIFTLCSMVGYGDVSYHHIATKKKKEKNFLS